MALLTLFLNGMTLFLSKLCVFLLELKTHCIHCLHFTIAKIIKNLVFHDSFQKSIFFLTLFMLIPGLYVLTVSKKWPQGEISTFSK
jgi:hypothetical protein